MKIFILSLCFFSFAFGDSFYKAKRQLLEYMFDGAISFDILENTYRWDFSKINKNVNWDFSKMWKEAIQRRRRRLYKKQSRQ